MQLASLVAAGDIFTTKIGKAWIDVKVPEGLKAGDPFTLAINTKKPLHDNKLTTFPMFIPFLGL